MSKKYYIKAWNQLEDEVYLDQIFLDAFDGEYWDDRIWIGGNRSFKEINSDLIKDVDGKISDIIYDLEYGFDYDDNYDTEEESNVQHTIDTIKAYFKKCRPGELTNKEINILFRVIQNWGTYSTYDEYTHSVIPVLEVIYDTKFYITTFKGYNQGDWVYCIYPEDEEEEVKYLEAVYFGTGYGYTIYVRPADSFEEAETMESIFGYTYHYEEQEVKKWAAGKIGCSSNDIVIIE